MTFINWLSVSKSHDLNSFLEKKEVAEVGSGSPRSHDMGNTNWV